MANIYEAFQYLWRELKPVRRKAWPEDKALELNILHGNRHTAIPFLREEDMLRVFIPEKEDYLVEDWVAEGGDTIPEMDACSTIYKAMICAYAANVRVRRRAWCPYTWLYVRSFLDGKPVLHFVCAGVEDEAEFIPAPADLLGKDWEFFDEKKIAKNRRDDHNQCGTDV